MDMRPSAPRTIGGTLDDAVRLYRSSFRQWWLPSLVTALAPLLMFATMGGTARAIAGAGNPAAALAAMASPPVLLSVLVLVVASIWAYATMFVALDGAYCGASPSLGTAASDGLRLAPAMVGASVLTGLAVVAGLVLLIIPGLIIAGRLQLTGIVLAAERNGVFNSIGRSWQLTGGHWWRAATILGVALLIQFVIAMALSVVLVLMVTFAFRGEPALLTALTLVIQTIERFFVAAFMPVATIALYHDLKLRADGDDLQQRAEALAAR